MKRLVLLVLLSLAVVLPAHAAGWSAGCLQSIAYGQTVSGTLATTDCSYYFNSDPMKLYYTDVYTFSGTAGQQVAIAMNSTAVDAWLDLYNVNDIAATALVTDDDGGGGTNARIPAGGGWYTLPTTGTYYIWANTAVANQTGAYTLTLTLQGTSSGPAEITAYEFYHPGFDHYFITAYQAEADNLIAGRLPPWQPTGKQFKVWSGSGTNITNVWRFFSASFAPKSGHFYTNNATEAASLRNGGTWVQETADAFFMMASPGGTCPAGTIALYRLYNDGQGGSPNHRYTTDLGTSAQMQSAGWVPEGNGANGVFACVPGGLTGGTFADPTGNASVAIAVGAIPAANAVSAPRTSAVTALPAGLVIDTADGEKNVTQGAAGYGFTLTGQGGFSTTTAGAVTIALPFNAAQVPAADLAHGARVLMRIHDPATGSVADLTGDVVTTGGTSVLRVETRGLPQNFTAAVVYSPNMESVTADTATVADSPPAFAPRAATVWPAQAWCIIYRRTEPELVTAVRNIYGLAGAPTAAQISTAVINRVGGAARKAQSIYQADGFNGPNLYIGRTACRDGVARYNVHMVNDGSHFTQDDPNEQASAADTHYGRLYIAYDRIDDSTATDLGSVLASVSHEMQHAIQSNYALLAYTTKGFTEGTATTYGKTIDANQSIRVRSETEMLDRVLMAPDEANRYNNEDFFAYVGRQYNGGKLNYVSSLWSQLQGTLGTPSAASRGALYGALDGYLRNAFATPLTTVYLDFVRQRALDHNANSQFGRGGEVVSGFAANLFTANGGVARTVDLATCTAKSTLNWTTGSYTTTVLQLRATGVLPAGVASRTLTVKLTPDVGAVGGTWGGFSYRKATSAPLAASNTFADFGKAAGEDVLLLFAHMDGDAKSRMVVEYGCGGIVITSLSPAKGPVDTTVTITGSGFGKAGDVRSVTFNGVTATNVQWTSDTQAVAKVPANASSGPVVVTVNGEASNGVNFEVVAQCSATQNAGGDVPDTRTIELGKTSGSFVFAYETYSQEDEIIVRYMGSTLFDTGCVGASGSKTLAFGGTSSQITVQVIPNCKGGSGTAWNYTVSCP
ncbi:MAG: IPT/TIG domain-containing protein [Burkholderiales bacterium]